MVGSRVNSAAAGPTRLSIPWYSVPSGAKSKPRGSVLQSTGSQPAGTSDAMEVARAVAGSIVQMRVREEPRRPNP